MSSIWFFEDVNLFSMLCPHKFKAYKKEHSFNNYNKQDYIYFEEDHANKVYLIEKGKVKIGYYTEEGEEVTKTILTRGEIFGEKAIFGEEKRNEFAQSLENTTSICPVDVETMHNLMRDNKPFSVKVYKMIGFRIKRLERRLELIMFKDAKTRLLEFLDDLSEDYGKETDDSGRIHIEHPFTQKEIATLIGVSRPTLNILMNQLKDEKRIDFKRKQIVYKKRSDNVS